MAEKSMCGSSQSNPCFDLLETIDKAKDGDTIMVDGQASRNQPLNICCKDFIHKSITIIGYNGQPRLTCNKTGHGATILIFTSAAYSYIHNFYLTILKDSAEQFGNHTIWKQDNKIVYSLKTKDERNGISNMEDHLLNCVKYVIPLNQCYQLWTNNEKIEVHIENMYFVKGFILASDIDILFLKCRFIDASIHFRGPQDLHLQVNQNVSDKPMHCQGMGIQLVKTNFLSEVPINHIDYLLLACITLKCDYVNMNFSDSLITGKTVILIPGVMGGDVIFNRVLFNASSNFGRYIGICVDNEDVEIQNGYRFRIDIFDSFLENISPDDKMLTVLFQYLRLSYGAIYISINGDIYLNIHNTTFRGNERAIGIDKSTGQINLQDCTFIGHSSLFGGSVMQVVDKHNNLTIHINNSIFDNNKAEYYNDTTFVDGVIYSEKMTFVGKLYERCCKVNQVGKQYRCWYDTKQKTVHVEEVNELSEVLAQHSILLQGHGAVIRATSVMVDLLNRTRQIGMVLIQCTFTNNEAENGNGGALYFDMYDVEIVECIFMSNRASRSGGAIHLSNSQVHIKFCLLRNNSAFNGGGLYGVGTNQTTQISHSVIRQNHAESKGGGVCQHGGRLLIEVCNITTNTAKIGGGGFYMENDITQMIYSTICSNQTRQCGERERYMQMGERHVQREGGAEFVLSLCNVISNTAVFGGGSYLKGVTINILYSKIVNNNAMQQGCCLDTECDITKISFKWCSQDLLQLEPCDGNGGGLFVAFATSTHILYSSITNNHAGKYGGGVYVYNGVLFVMAGCNVTSNIAIKNGGGLYLSYVSLSCVSYNSLHNNQAGKYGGGVRWYKGARLIMTGCNVTSNTAGYGCGGFHLEEHNRGFNENATCQREILITECTVRSNCAVIGRGGGGCLVMIWDIVMTYCMIEGNQAWEGGGVYVMEGLFVMTRCNVTYNTGDHGGGLYMFSVSAHLSYCSIINNKAWMSGGGMEARNSKFIMTWCDIILNTAKGNGGGLLLQLVTANLTYCKINQNEARKQAGGVGVYIPVSTFNLNLYRFVMSWCDVTFNTAVLNGGGLWLSDQEVISGTLYNTDGVGVVNVAKYAPVSITGCNITFNKAVNQSGGGLYLRNIATNMSFCTIAHNEALYGGGVTVWLSPDFVMEKCNIIYNVAMLDGGGLSLNYVTIRILDSNIANNQAWQIGGGVNVWKSKFVMIGCNIISNKALENGGGLSLNNGTMAHISHSRVVNNEAMEYGGGINMLGQKFEMILCDIISNRAKQSGGGLWLYNITKVYLSHSWIDQNDAGEHAGGVGGYQSKIIMTKCNITSNTAGGDGGGMWLDGLIPHLLQNKTGVMHDNKSRVFIGNSWFNENRAIVNGDTCYMKGSTGHILNSIFQLIDGRSHLDLRFASITVENSSLFGGYLQVKSDSILTLNTVIILIKHQVTTTWQGAIISEGKTIYNGVMLYINNNTNNLGNIDVLLQNSPGYSVIRDLHISCPYRHDIHVDKITHNNIFMLLKIFCKVQCDIGYNRFTSGHIQLTTSDNDRDIEVFHTPICVKCPFGGKCTQTTLSSKPGFWGGILEFNVVFYPCKTQCFSCSTNCSDDMFTICALHREGPICTECAVNYTETLFSSSCVPDSKCTDSWFVPVVIIVGIVYSLFLLFQQDCVNFIVMVPIRIRTSDDHTQTQINTQTPHYDSTFLVNIFYYFQDAALLLIITPYSQPETSTVSSMKEIIAGLFEFRLDLLHLGEDICVFPGLNVAKKIALKTLFFPLMWVIILTLYGIASCLKNKVGNIMCCRSANAFMLSILFSFQKLAIAYFSLIHCSMIFKTNVLQVQATTECYTYWQILIIVYLAVCIIPFGVYLMLCTRFIKESQIPLGIFFLGCIFPLPIILYCFIISLNQNNPSVSGIMAQDVQATFDIIQGPYRNMKLFGIEVCWGGVLVLRRTLLLVLYTLVQTPLLRSLLIFFLCCGFLLLHNIILPYSDLRSNIADTISQGALTILSGINMIRAMLDSQQSVPLAHTQFILDVIDYIDHILQLWLPGVGISILFLLLLVRIALTVTSYCSHHVCGVDSDASHIGDNIGNASYGSGKNSDTGHSRASHMDSGVRHLSVKINNPSYGNGDKSDTSHSSGKNTTIHNVVDEKCDTNHSSGKNTTIHDEIDEEHDTSHSSGKNITIHDLVDEESDTSHSSGKNTTIHDEVDEQCDTSHSSGKNTTIHDGIDEEHGTSHSSGKNTTIHDGISEEHGTSHSSSKNTTIHDEVDEQCDTSHSIGKNITIHDEVDEQRDISHIGMISNDSHVGDSNSDTS